MAGLDVADHIPHEFARGKDVHPHDRPQQHGIGLQAPLPKGGGGGDLAPERRRLPLLLPPPENRDPDIDHRIPRENAAERPLADALLHRGQLLFGDVGPLLEPADDHHAPAPLRRLQDQFHMAEVFFLPQLLFKEALAFDAFPDRFAVNDPRLAHIDPGIEFPLQPVGDDFQMKLPHARQDRLGGLVVVLDPQGRILLHELVQRQGQLLLIGGRLGLDRQADDRLVKIDRLQQDGVLLVAEGIARGDLLEPHRGDDLPGACLLHALALVRVHLQKAGDLFPLPLGGIVKLVPRVDAPRIDAQIRQLPPFILHDLEGQSRQRLLVAARADLLPPGQRVGPGNGGNVFRRRQILDHRVQQRLHPLVAERGTA